MRPCWSWQLCGLWGSQPRCPRFSTVSHDPRGRRANAAATLTLAAPQDTRGRGMRAAPPLPAPPALSARFRRAERTDGEQPCGVVVGDLIGAGRDRRGVVETGAADVVMQDAHD